MRISILVTLILVVAAATWFGISRAAEGPRQPVEIPARVKVVWADRDDVQSLTVLKDVESGQEFLVIRWYKSGAQSAVPIQPKK